MIKAYAKINLSLKVIKKLENGYHNLEMINTKIFLFDEITIEESSNTYITYDNFIIDQDKDNIYKVVKALRTRYSNIPNIHIHINKKIPVGGGLGGMSSDIAEVVKYLNNKYNLGMTNEELINFVFPFGTDICYCLYNEPCKVTGLGEIVEPIEINLPDKLILLSPRINVSTKDVFENYQKTGNQNSNDLEETVKKLYPIMNQIIAELTKLNIGKIQITGSGSAIMIFNDKEETLKILKEKYPEYDINIYNIMKGEK